MLTVANVTKHYGGTVALRSASLRLEPGQILGLIGPNGAGKTTLLNVVSGFAHPDAGQVRFRSIDITVLPPYQIARLGIGRTFQELRIIRHMNALENVLVGLREARHLREYLLPAKSQRSAHDCLRRVGLEHMAQEPAGRLSFGQQKLLSLACALALESRVLLLDEPFAGVASEMVLKVQTLLRALASQGRGVVIVDHRIDLLRQVASALAVMIAGTVITQGKPEIVLAEPSVRRSYLGT